MSGKSGQLLTSTFFDDCENIVLHNGYPVFVVDKDTIFEDDARVEFSSLEEVSERLGLSVDVLKDLTKLANVNLLERSRVSNSEAVSVVPLRNCGRSRLANQLYTIVNFGNSSDGLYQLEMTYTLNGDFISGIFQLIIE